MSECQDIRGRLSDWADGGLDAADADRVRAHLTTCVDCRRLAEDLAAIGEAARALGPVAPPDHLWLEVAGQIRLDTTRSSRVLPARPAPRAWMPWLGLAAALVIVTVGVWVVTPPGDERGAGSEATGVDAVSAELNLAMQHYERAIATLEEMSASGDLPVEPAITATLRENLGVVDQAIADSQQALAADPASESARDSLFDALRQKVGLLQATVTLINEIRRAGAEPSSPASGSGRSS